MICPNLSDPQVRKEFSEMASLFGEPLAYLLWNKNGGYPLDKNLKGEYDEDFYEVYKQTHNRVKAMQMRALTFGSNFKKFTNEYNKEFSNKDERLPYGYKAAALYLQANNQKTIEELIQDSLRNSSLLRPIVDAITTLQKNDVARDRSWFNITKKEQAQAYLWYKSHPISKVVPFRNLSRVVNNTSLASLEDMVIKLYQGGDYTLLYHETWHAFSQAYLTKSERDAIYTLIRDRVGTRNGVAYNDMLREQVEEVLAEEFENFVKEEKDLKKTSIREPFLQRLFKQIVEFFKAILKSDSPKDVIKDYYKNLYYGEFTRKRNDANIEFANLSAGKGLGGKYKSNEALIVPDNVVANLRQGAISGFLSELELEDGLYSIKTGESSSAIISIVKIGEKENLKRYMASMQQEFQVGVAEGVETFKAFDFMFYEGMRNRNLNVINVMSNKALRAEIYDEIKERFNVIYSEKKKQWLELSKTMPGSAMADHLQEQFILLFDIINAFDSFKNEHRKMMNKTLSEARDIVEAAGQDDEVTKGRTAEGWETDPFSINPIDNADAVIFTFVKSLPDIDPKRTDSKGNNLITLGQLTGLPQTGNFDRNWNILINNLNGITSYEKMRGVLSNLTKSFPQFKIFLDLIPANQESAKDPAELAITQGMLQTFSSPQISPFALQIIEKGLPKQGKDKIYQFNLFEQHTTAAKKIKASLDYTFQIDDTRSYRLERDKEFYLDTTSIVSDYKEQFMDSKNSSFKLDFLAEVTGLDFRDELENPLVKSHLDKIKKYADHMFRMVYVNYLDMMTTALGGETDAKKVMYIRNPLGGLSRTFSAADYDTKNKAYVIGANNTYKDPTFQKLGILTDFKHETEEITSLYDRVFQIHGDQSYINPENSLQWSILQWNELTYQINQWNAATSVQDLANNLHTKQLVEKDFFKFSAFAKKTFAEIGGAKLKGPSGLFKELKIINWSGVTSKVTYGERSVKEGFKSTSIDAQDKFVYDFFSYINNGLFENLRFGSKNISLAIATDGSKKNRQVYPTSEFLKGDVIMDPTFLSQMTDYLAYEIRTANQYGGRLGMFSDMLSEKTKSEALLLESLDDEQLVRKLKQGDLGQRIREEITTFFVNDSKDFMRAMKFALLRNHLSDKPEKQDDKLVEAVKKFSVDIQDTKDLQRLVLAYLSNYYAHQTEVLNLFISDIRNYQAKRGNFKEVFKRLGAVSSPGRQPLISEGYISSFQRFYKRDLGSISSNKEQSYDRKVRFAIGKDIVTNATHEDVTIEYFSRQLAAMREATGQAPLSKEALREQAEKDYGAYKTQDKEADAQAWGNLDFMRMYLHSIRRWTPQHEAAYRREKAIWEAHINYKRAVKEKAFNKAEDLLKEVNKLMRSIPENPALFPSLKLGFYGSPLSSPNQKTLGKFSVNILLPSMIIGSDLEELADSMFETQTDIYTFKSGSKMQFPGEEHELYSKDGSSFTTNRLNEKNVVEYSIEGLREQQYIAPIFKGKATLSTQMVKLIFGDFFEDGKISPEFASIKDITLDLQSRFTDALSKLIEIEKITLAGRMGVKFDGNEVVSIDKKKFFHWLSQEAEKKEVNEDFIEFALRMSKSDDPYSVDSFGFRNLVESMLMTSVNKKVIKPKFNGEAFIQTASTGYGKQNERYTNPTVDDLETYGINGLRDYRLVNGKVEPADIKLAFNPQKHGGLLKLDWNGKTINTLNALNKALQDESWVQEHSEKISIAGVRIPVQGFNSMEHFRVREFLPTSAGAIIIVPPSIVTKSGSDFDIDKLFMYEPTIDEEGNIVNIPFDKQILIDRDSAITAVDSAIADINKAIEDLEASSGIEEISKEDLKFLKDFKAKYSEITTGKKKKLDFETGMLVAKFNTLSDALSKQKGQENTVKELEELKKELTEWETRKGLIGESSPSAQKYTLQNEVLRVLRETLSLPELYSRLTKPNDSRLLYGKGGAINDVYEYINKHTPDSNKHQEVDQPMSASDVPSAKASTIIHKDGIGGKKPLGVVAKANALHKLYQQAGLRWVNDLFKVGFVLPHNTLEKGEIPLGAVYNVEGESIADLISQFINGHVDVEKEDWINRIRSDKRRAPLYMQLIMQGVPMRTAITFMMQPVLNEYFRDSKNSFFKKLVAGKRISKGSVYKKMLTSTMNAIQPGSVSADTEPQQIIATVLANPEYREILENFSLEDSAKNYLPSFKDVAEDGWSKLIATKDVEKLKYQLAVLVQYKILEQQNDILFEFSSNIDFNTANYSTLQEAYNNREFLSRGMIGDEYLDHYFNVPALDFIKDQSVVSPFNVSDYAVELNRQFSTIIGNESYMRLLYEYSQKKLKDGEWYPSEAAKEINKFNNTFIESLLWNFNTSFRNPNAKEGENNFYRLQTRFPITLFTNGSPNFLRDRWNKIQKSPYYKDIPTVGWKNLKFRQSVYDEQNYYPVMITASGDPSTIDAYKQEFDTLLNFKHKDADFTEEVQDFFHDLGLGSFVHQGFRVKLNTIQPLIPLTLTAPIIENSIRNFKEKMVDEEFLRGYFNAFAVNTFPNTEDEMQAAVQDFKDQDKNFVNYYFNQEGVSLSHEEEADNETEEDAYTEEEEDFTPLPNFPTIIITIPEEGESECE